MGLGSAFHSILGCFQVELEAPLPFVFLILNIEDIIWLQFLLQFVQCSLLASIPSGKTL